jgi:hypothetical protein
MRISDNEVVEVEKVVLSLHVQCEVTISSSLGGLEPKVRNRESASCLVMVGS